MREEIKPTDRLFVRSWVYKSKVPNKTFDYTTSYDCEIVYEYI